VPTMHMVRASTYNSTPEFMETLKIFMAGCRHLAGISGELPFEFPNLQNVHFKEEEEFFDGPKHALYSAHMSLMADPARNCAWVGVMQYHVTIESSCAEQLTVSTGSIHQAEMDRLTGEKGDTAQKEPLVTVERTPTGFCSEHIKPETVGRAPVEALPFGARCVWNSALLQQTANPTVALRPGPSDEGFGVDLCVDARWLHYPFASAVGTEIPVVYRVHKPDISEAERRMGFPVDGHLLDLISYEEGQKIAPSRFTRAAAEEFARQPVIRLLGQAQR